MQSLEIKRKFGNIKIGNVSGNAPISPTACAFNPKSTVIKVTTTIATRGDGEFANIALLKSQISASKEKVKLIAPDCRLERLMQLEAMEE